MISPESIRVESLPSVPLHDRKALPSNPCIYFAIDGQGGIQYIGRSVNPRQRWANHHRYQDLLSLGGVRISYMPVEPELIDAVERALISWFEPPLNGQKAPHDEALRARENALKDMRLRVDLTREQVAMRCGVTAGTVSNWERGQTVPTGTAEFFLTYCECYQCTFEYLAEVCEIERYLR